MTDDGTEPAVGPDDEATADEPSSRLDAALDAFKGHDDGADSSGVSDTGRPRMKWSPVTETGADRRDAPPERSSFTFDLGGALERLSGGSPGTTEQRQNTIEREESQEAGSPTPEPVEPESPAPDLEEAADGDTSETPSELVVERPAPDDQMPTAEPPVAFVREPEPVVPPAPEPAESPAAPPVDEAAPKPVAESADESAGPMVGTTTATPADSAPTVPSPGLPRLPASVPSAPPPMVAPVSGGPPTMDLNAVRAAQQRAAKNQRQGKLLGRSLLAFVLIGAAIAGALVFGRSYLFPAEWGREMTPLVDEIQIARGVEFDHSIGLVERPADQYAVEITDHLFGDGWADHIDEWRALGIAGGEGAVAEVRSRIADLYPAFYDPGSDTIVASNAVDAEGRAPAIRLALETAFLRQIDGREPVPGALGLTGFDDPEAVSRTTADAAAAGLVGTAPDATADLVGVPLPVAYRLRLVDDVGPALLDGRPAVRVGDPLAVSLAGATRALADDPVLTEADQVASDPKPLGADAWALVWGTRIPPATADRLADLLTADSYTVVDRAGTTCVAATFRTGSTVAADELLAGLATWVALTPDRATASLEQIAPDRVQLSACDPGPDAAITPRTASVDLVLSRQLDRLG